LRGYSAITVEITHNTDLSAAYHLVAIDQLRKMNQSPNNEVQNVIF